jgi:NAD(P)-dependent dehydrogenase (short-subunit alcohol dehydrogenase family)
MTHETLEEITDEEWQHTFDTNITAMFRLVQAALPHLGEGASIIATASAAALMDASKVDQPGKDLGGVAYMFSKKAISQYIHELATHLAPRGIRANVVHPTNCNTDMLKSEPMYRSFRPDLEQPTLADAEPAFYVQQAMRVPWVEPIDISNMVLFLASEESRYVTGMQMRVDAGGYLKWYDYHV